LNGGSDSPLSCIVGWLDTLAAQKGDKNVPVLKETSGACPDTLVGTVPVSQAGAFHAASVLPLARYYLIHFHLSASNKVGRGNGTIN